MIRAGFVFLLLVVPVCCTSSSASPRFTEDLPKTQQQLEDLDEIHKSRWQIEVSSTWDVLGPFPIHAREQYFLNPSFPLDLTPQYVHESGRLWTSSYSTNGSVGWSKAISDKNGDVAVSFPDIDWNALRSTEGWAALQYHSVLRTEVTVYPPDWYSEDRLGIFSSSDVGSIPKTGTPRSGCHNEGGIGKNASKDVPFRLLVTLLRGSQFTFIPAEEEPGSDNEESPLPIWHTGNIYGMNRAPPNPAELPTVPSNCDPTKYYVFVSGDYEVRLFGDPKDKNDPSPTVRLHFSVSLEMKENTVVREESHDILPDFVDGYMFGTALSVGLRSVDGWWTIQGVTTANGFPPEVNFILRHDSMHEGFRQPSGSRGTWRLAPTQTRALALILNQNAPCHAESLTLFIDLFEENPDRTMKGDTNRLRLSVTLKLKHLEMWSPDGYDTIKASFLFMNSTPTSFFVKPPTHLYGESVSGPTILALHGAGVDIFATPFWANAIPRQNASWTVIPPGRTEWGLDWHGPSAIEAWECVSALTEFLGGHNRFHAWHITKAAKIVLLGHSNGGQGVWYMASRFPDRVLAAVPAAGYIKAQAYVPMTQSRSAHLMDPALRAILESSLTPDDNDLFLSNLVDVPIFAIHGGADSNVPTWHTRQYVSSLADWGANDVELHIEEGKPHFYPDIFKGDKLHDFLRRVESRVIRRLSPSFTLTVVNPANSGSMRGWTIDLLRVPGRVAKLNVKLEHDMIIVHTENVKQFSIDKMAFGSNLNITVDSLSIQCYTEADERKTYYSIESESTTKWVLSKTQEHINDPSFCPASEILPGDSSVSTGDPHGRAQEILESPDIHVIVTTDDPIWLSAAQRIAHILDVFHKLDSHVLTVEEAMALWSQSPAIDFPLGNIIALGKNDFTDKMINRHLTPFSLYKQGLGYTYEERKVYSEPGTGLLLLQPHPFNHKAKSIILTGVDSAGSERAIRLFPYRTGVIIPDFLVIGPSADQRGAAGVLGAGIFGACWGPNDPMTWQT